jgi:hypothetical protein
VKVTISVFVFVAFLRYCLFQDSKFCFLKQFNTTLSLIISGSSLLVLVPNPDRPDLIGVKKHQRNIKIITNQSKTK